ncbi:SDR family oxidoreductase [Pallidibacillus thermolactis]|uniref:SDR family oxidoreductase n=1 Tax=Pallidibacillus thermolactis TaxID=251051 RepID=UPI0021D81756|nr:SDR family oxidoreductase [Pallidibacillus thermolactis]MCU9600455.1 SDR family oxidoreductase [Pallidibacillus thermolactis subsp. kokeshiiformis]
MDKKHVLIFGSEGYIGLDLQKRFDLEKYSLICIDQKPQDQVQKESNKVYLQLDITSEEDQKFLVSYLERENIEIHYLVYLVGINTMDNFFTITDENWDKTFQTNIKSFVFLLKKIYHFFAKKVAIVTVASQNGVVAHEDRIAYGTSKAALIHLTKNLSIDFLKDKSRDIKVNCVSPSYVKNESNQTLLNSHQGRTYLNRIPYRKFLEAKDVSNVILFLLSEKSDAIRGQNIVVDYGYTII